MQEIVHLGKHYYPDFGGIEKATQDLAESATKLGYRVTCITASATRAPKRDYDVNGVEVRRAKTFAKVLSTPIAPSYLRERFYPSTLLHVHLPNPLAEISAFFHLMRAGKQGVLLPFFHAMPFRGRGIGRLWYNLVTRPLLRRSRKIMVSSAHLIDAFPPLAEFREKISVLPFAAEVLSQAEVNKLWPTRHEAKIVLALGRLVPYKGYVGLVKAWARAAAKDSGYRLVIVGHGPEKPAIEQCISELGLLDSVQIVSSCTDEEKIAWYRRASLFAMPSLNESETFGISALEAMGHGLPLIASDLSTGLKQLARGGACGAVVQAGNVESLATALSSLLAKPLPLESVGERNRQFVEENFSHYALTRTYERFLREV